MTKSEIKLTEYAHGGGCGCKIAPAVLSEMLAKLPKQFADPGLLVGLESGDDAAVYQINDAQAVVATTDFFMPIVDDPFDFGRIAATNALSDVYAIGGRPILALAVVGMPVDKLPMEAIQQIMAGGAAVCEAAGVALAGGHSIDTPEPIYGLVAIGLADPATIKRNDRARAGDALILGKGLGVGILGAALKKGELSPDGYQEMLSATTRLNSVGVDLATLPGVHALTDVTGFGLLGHLLEVCRGAQLGATVDFGEIPILPTARGLAESGFNTGAAGRNWASYGHEVKLPGDLGDWQQNLLCDPQTSGGLLVACDPVDQNQILELFHAQDFGEAAVIGSVNEGPAEVRVTFSSAA